MQTRTYTLLFPVCSSRFSDSQATRYDSCLPTDFLGKVSLTTCKHVLTHYFSLFVVVALATHKPLVMTLVYPLIS